jgi:hypothetical protein
MVTDKSSAPQENFHHHAELQRALTMFFEPGQVTELRALEVSTPTMRRPHTVSGYFDDLEALATEAATVSRYAKGVYIVPNVVEPALLARAANRVRAVDREPTTADTNIRRRRWLLIDADPARPAGISSTNIEHEAALARVQEVAAALTVEGWPAGALADSGNGGHLLYRVDLPNDDASRILLERVLQALAFRFDDAVVTVDQKVFNAARIWKLYGTMARKGDHTADRPHRLARLLSIPETWALVTREQLEALARQRPEAAEDQAPPREAGRRRGEAFDLERWMVEHGLEVIGPLPWQGGRKWIFSVCPWNSEHRNRSAFLVERANGALAAGCHHNGCAGNDWQALRTLYEPGWRERGRPRAAGQQPRRAAPPGGETQTQAEPESSPPSSDMPVIQITTDMTAVVNATQAAILALPEGPYLFQRARQLCVIGREVRPPQWLHRPPQAPVILPAGMAHVRELATQAATWTKYDKRQKAWEPALPPTWVLETLYARPFWPFPSLEGIVCAPTLRPDGSVLATPGYDRATGLYLDLNGTTYPPIRARPTLDHARTAIGRLQEVFLDFPFAAPHHFSTVLAAVLSLVARYAIQGRVPLFAARSTTRGTGKGLAIDAISVIATGRPAPRWAHTLDQEEERKRLLTIALAGDALIHIDNVIHPFGSAPLDLAITAPTISERVLGQLQSREAPMHVVFFASGNNMVFKGDMARRVVPIDLAPDLERPEEREQFRHSPLLPWVLKERPALVVSALTILKAYVAAGCPRQGVTPLGSFEEWSGLVRQALIWAGEPDPCAGRQEIEADSDPQYEALQTLLAAWYTCYGTQARTVRQVVEDIRRQTGEALVSSDLDALRDALGSFDPQYPSRGLNPKLIGEALRRWKGRRIGDKRFVKSGQTQHPATWRIEVLTGEGGRR